MLTPVPCSALSEPSYLSTISSTSSSMNGVVALEVLGLGEVRGEHEVEVPGRRVAGDAGEEAVLAEQRLQVRRRLGDPLRRHADVLDDQRRARRAQLADQAVQALAHRPEHLDRLVRRGEVAARGSARGRRAPRPRAPRPRRARPRRRRRTRPAAPPTPGRAPASSPGVPRMLCEATISAGATISSTARAPAATSSATGAIAASMPGEVKPRARSSSRGCATVSKTASAMNASVPSEPTSRRRKISSGVSASRKAQSR